MKPQHINTLQWHQTVGYARQCCAGVFRDGGTAADAMGLFGLDCDAEQKPDWSVAVEAIAASMCASPLARAA